MTHLRFWIVASGIWMFVFYNVARFVQPIGTTPLAYLYMAAVAVAIVSVRGFQKQHPAILVGGLSVLFVLLKGIAGYSVFGPDLAVTIIELTALAITVGLALQIFRSIDQFERAAAEAAMVNLETELSPFETGQSEIYREIRRARQFDRPLSLVTIAATGENMDAAMHEYLQEVQRKSIGRYVQAQIADLLSKESSHCDLISRRDDHFVMLLPETDHDRAHEIASRLKESAQEKLGLSVKAGTASFPDQEVTFAGLLERAEAEMQGHDLKLVSEH